MVVLLKLKNLLYRQSMTQEYSHTLTLTQSFLIAYSFSSHHNHRRRLCVTSHTAPQPEKSSQKQ